jgi:protein SCO1/2
MMTGRSLAPWLIVIAAFAAGRGFLFGARALAPAAPPQLQAVTLFPTTRPLPDFHLTRANGESLTLADWKGRWTLAYFGFTNCPDVCPMTLAAFKLVWKRLEADGRTDRLRVDFISVDPERDTPEQLTRYVGFYSPDFVAATGTDAELGHVTSALGLLYTRTPNADGGVDVDHSASAVLIDPDGNQAGLVRPPFDAARIAADLEALMDWR